MASMRRILNRLHGWFVGHHPDHHNAECYLQTIWDWPYCGEYGVIVDHPVCGRSI